MLQRLTQLIRGSPKSVRKNKHLENYDQNDERSPEQVRIELSFYSFKYLK